MINTALIRSTWEKTLEDGSKEVSTVAGLEKGEDSWTKGRQDIKKVKLLLGNRSIEIICDRALEWKQYDNYLYSAIHGSSILASAEIRCKPKIPVTLTYVKQAGVCPRFVLKEPREGENSTSDWVAVRLLPDGRFTVHVYE